jgi:hypothetical protein
MDSEIEAAFASLAKLVDDMNQSLQSAMARGFECTDQRIDQLQADMNRGFERVEEATRRNSSMLAGGTTALAALNRWAS